MELGHVGADVKNKENLPYIVASSKITFITLFIYYFRLFIAKQKYYTGEWVRYDTFVCAHDLLQKYDIKYIAGRKYRKTIMGREVYITARCIMAM